MYTQSDFDVITNIVRKDVPCAVSIVLFGSYAKAGARPDSDIDIAILTGHPVERREKLRLLASLRWEIARRGYNADFVLKSRADFLSESRLPTLSSVILKEGRVLWEKQ